MPRPRVPGASITKVVLSLERASPSAVLHHRRSCRIDVPTSVYDVHARSRRFVVVDVSARRRYVVVCDEIGQLIITNLPVERLNICTGSVTLYALRFTYTNVKKACFIAVNLTGVSTVTSPSIPTRSGSRVLNVNLLAFTYATFGSSTCPPPDFVASKSPFV